MLGAIICAITIKRKIYFSKIYELMLIPGWFRNIFKYIV